MLSQNRKNIYYFASFAAVGGFLEAFTFLLHGGVFCNAQTGNLVLFALNLSKGQFSDGAKYLYALVAYIAGILLSCAIPLHAKKLNLKIAVTGFEIAALCAIAFIPDSASNWFTYVSVAFLCALQYNTFTECAGVKIATTFCTNNLRQAVMRLYRGIALKDCRQLKESGLYAFVILCFAAGAVAGGISAKYMGNFCILLCPALLLPVLLTMIFTKEKPTDGPAAPTGNADGICENQG
ncbi:MAG TPA: DUF1275 domain-containing protein [Candidatus Borkfalkia excrementavium]|uniref:DUF1275 domain-containing protein n=1 Tax=Candidatus Borkfalkia excrementavium TaxID=2838505 RepID=A0A9D2CFJ8_9FIRM|nr:DUF1275 domain-containing protein [Candidatus Borkfalkia excrementavium]